MHSSNLALLISGGIVLAGIAYPGFAQAQPGWKVSAWVGGGVWSLWFGMGALAYLAGMANVFGWKGFLGAIPLAFAGGFVLILAAGRRAQVIALPGPFLANLWFMG